MSEGFDPLFDSQPVVIRCRLGSRPPAPCWDDLCHSGGETLCGIPDEWLYPDDEWGEEYPDDE
jgi:hypothetical protein